jgi:hypothetical protein
LRYILSATVDGCATSLKPGSFSLVSAFDADSGSKVPLSGQFRHFGTQH